MPTKSARLTEFGRGTATPISVGPGSYLRAMKRDGHACPSLAPFATSQHRTWQRQEATATGPGPGAYESAFQACMSSPNVRPSSCFGSKAPRLAPQYTGSTTFRPSTVVEVPGPGEYESHVVSRRRRRGQAHASVVRQNSAPSSYKRPSPPSVPRYCSSPGLRAL